MIKKLRNFLISQKRNLKYSNYDISFDHLADVAQLEGSNKALIKTSISQLSDEDVS